MPGAGRPKRGTGRKKASRPAAASRGTPARTSRAAPAPVDDYGARYRDLLEHLPVGVYRTTPDGVMLEANQAITEMLGYASPDDLRQVNVRNLYVHERDRREHLAGIGAGFLPAEFVLARRDGTTIWVRDYCRAVADRAGAVRFYDGILVDITAEKAAGDALRQSEHDYRQLFAHAHDAIIIFAADDERILEVNQRACEMYGFARDEMVGASLEQLSKNVPLGKERIRETLASGTHGTFETVHVRKDGRELTVEVNAAVLEHRGRAAILSINRDISERRALEQAVREMAFHDPLTGLPNRKLLSDRLELALAQARRARRGMAVLFLDLDGFKVVNDTWGHAQGDALLRDVAGRLAGALRTGDTVARLGGDEFTVLIPDLPGEAAAEEVSRKILRELERRFRVGDTEYAVTASIGIARYPRDGETADALLRSADTAMYRAKAAGGNRFSWYGR